MTGPTGLARRTLLAGVLAAAAPLTSFARAATVTRNVRFEVWRNDERIGTHAVSFQGDDQNFVAMGDVEMLVKLGPFPLFRYRHQARETWRGGRFAELATETVANGQRTQVHAVASAGAVVIETGDGRRSQAPASAHPLTHWNAAALKGPLFNPQTGAALRVRVSSRFSPTMPLPDGRTEPATRYDLSGAATISDWYDVASRWTSLRGKAPDGSVLVYRRAA